jgi:hypothetical protein
LSLKSSGCHIFFLKSNEKLDPKIMKKCYTKIDENQKKSRLRSPGQATFRTKEKKKKIYKNYLQAKALGETLTYYLP